MLLICKEKHEMICRVSDSQIKKKPNVLTWMDEWATTVKSHNSVQIS